MVAAAIEPDEGVQSAHQWMREVKQSLEDYPSPLLLLPSPTTLSCLDTFLDQRVMPVCPGTLPSILHTSPQFIPHRNPGEELSAVCNSSLLLQQHRRPLPPQNPGHKESPKRSPRAQLRSSPAAEYTLAHAAGPWAAWPPHLQQLLPSLGCALGPTP